MEDVDRIGTVTALGLDEALFCRMGPYRIPGVVDLDCRCCFTASCSTWSKAAPPPGPCRWLEPPEARPGWTTIVWATLDLSGPYRAVFDTMLPDAVQIADPLRGIPRNGSYGEPRIMWVERGWGGSGLGGSEVAGPSG